MPEPQLDDFFRRPREDATPTKRLPRAEPEAEPGGRTSSTALDEPPEHEPDRAGDDLHDLLRQSSGPAVPRLTRVLLAGLALVGTFAAGVAVERYENPPRGTGAATFARAGTGARGTGAGTFGGAGGSFAGAGAAGAGSAGAGSASSSVPVVVGTVVRVSGTTLTVRNFAGRQISVSVPAGTPVTRSTGLALGALTPGTTVSVTGTTGAGGAVTADGVTARSGS